jgi:iron complex transport system ATP-binding protein
VIGERSFKKISNSKLGRSFELLEKVDHVIDSGFPIGSSNSRNLKLILKALEQGKRVYTLRNWKPACDLYGESAENLIYCDGPKSILEKIVKCEKEL